MKNRSIVLALSLLSIFTFGGCSVFYTEVPTVASKELLEEDESDISSGSIKEQIVEESKNLSDGITKAASNASYDKALELFDKLIYESKDSNVEANETYESLKEFLTLSISIITDNVGGIEKSLKDLVNSGELIANELFDENTQKIIDEANTYIKNGDLDKASEVLESLDIESLKSDISEVMGSIINK